jgi:hypothetical protein
MGWLDVRDGPIRERCFNLVATGPSDQRSPSLRPYEQQKRRVESSNGLYALSHRCALIAIEVVKGARVKDESKSGTHADLR